MNIAIIDDISADRAALRSLLESCISSAGLNAYIDEYSDGTELIASSGMGYDLIFLDIYMKGTDGIETARYLRSRGDDTPIVFLTTSNDYAAESYEVEASGYLIKPVSEQRLFPLMDKLMKSMHKTGMKLNVTTKGRSGISLAIEYGDIMYIDVEKKTVNVHVRRDTIQLAEKFTECAPILLRDRRFSNCCRGIIVNFDYVDYISGNDFVLKNGERIPIRNHNSGEIKKEYMAYELKDFIT